VCQKVDVIVAYGGAVGILKRATATIPIVFAIATDPVGSGLVASLAQPGGNVTGSSNQGADVAGKRIELLRAVLPRLRRLAIMFDTGYPGAVLESGEVQAAARKLGLEVASHEIRRSEDIEPVFDALKGQADALYLVENDLVNLNSERLGAFALSARLPTISNSRNMVEAGGLMSYGPNFPALFRRAAEFVDKILRGTKPRELPVEQPTKFDLVINLKIAETLGLTIPESFLSLADEVIE
jgi:putative tryptophan/tyrosine transport system substrate-binding protein